MSEEEASVLIVRLYGPGEQMGKRIVQEAEFDPAEDVDEWWDDAERDYAKEHGEWQGRKERVVKSRASIANSSKAYRYGFKTTPM